MNPSMTTTLPTAPAPQIAGAPGLTMPRTDLGEAASASPSGPAAADPLASSAAWSRGVRTILAKLGLSAARRAAPADSPAQPKPAATLARDEAGPEGRPVAQTRSAAFSTLIACTRLGEGPGQDSPLSRRAMARLDKDPFVRRLARLH